MLLRERGDHTLALFLDFLGEAGMLLLDKAGGEPELEQRHREGSGKIVEVGARLGELHCLARLVAQLLERFGELLVEEFFHGWPISKKPQMPISRRWTPMRIQTKFALVFSL